LDDDGRVRGGGAAFDMRGSLAPAASSSGSAICGMAKLSLSAGFATISSITSFNGGFALPLPMRRLETDPRDESTLDPSRLLIEPVAAGGPTTAGGVARKDGTMSAFWAVASEAPPAAGCVTSSAMAAVSESAEGPPRRKHAELEPKVLHRLVASVGQKRRRDRRPMWSSPLAHRQHHTHAVSRAVRLSSSSSPPRRLNGGRRGGGAPEAAESAQGEE
jgi:hypothetical protein